MCSWEGLLSLNLAETLAPGEKLDYFVSCIPSLQELVASSYPSQEVIAKWCHLQKLCIPEFNEELLTNVVNAAQKGFFPVLESVCIRQISPTFRNKTTNLHNSEAFFKLVKADISCHLEVLSEQPFTPSKCVCEISKKPAKLSIPWGTKYVVCAAGLLFSNQNPEDFYKFLWHY